MNKNDINVAVLGVKFNLQIKSMYLFAAVVVFSFIMVMIYPRKQKGGKRK